MSILKMSMVKSINSYISMGVYISNNKHPVMFHIQHSQDYQSCIRSDLENMHIGHTFGAAWEIMFLHPSWLFWITCLYKYYAILEVQ